MVFNRRFKRRSRRRFFKKRFIGKPFRKKVKKVVKDMSETKLVQANDLGTQNATGALYIHYLNIAEGAGKDQRIGSKVQLKRLSWYYTIRFVSLTGAIKSTRVRVIVWHARNRPVLSSNFDLNIYSLNDPQLFVTISDKVHTLYNDAGLTTVAGMPSTINVKGSYIRRHVVNFFEDAAVTTDPKGCFGMWIVFDANPIDVNIATDLFWRVSYKDI